MRSDVNHEEGTESIRLFICSFACYMYRPSTLFSVWSASTMSRLHQPLAEDRQAAISWLVGLSFRQCVSVR